MIINSIITPIFHVSLNIKDLKYIPRPMWIYKQKKNIEAPLAWIFRNKNPFQVSNIIKLILLKANKVSGVYRNAKNNPLIICTIKHSPNIDPRFQNRLILIGVGKLINELFKIIIRGLLFFFKNINL